MNEKLNKELLGLNIFTKYLNDDIKNHSSTSNSFSTDMDIVQQQLQLQKQQAGTFSITNELLKEALDRSLLYIIYLNQTNEQFNSINFLVINKWRNGKLTKNQNFNIRGITKTN